jgi:hypothetical protein
MPALVEGLTGQHPPDAIQLAHNAGLQMASCGSCVGTEGHSLPLDFKPYWQSSQLR